MDKNRKIEIMGIVNITDNSYYGASRCLDAASGKPDIDKILKKAEQIINEGADIIDIGACSTRPGSDPVGEITEWSRLSVALKEIRNAFPEIRISIDTYWSSVVEKAYNLIGPYIVNDISAGEDDPKMLETTGKLGLEYIAMHKRGNPKTMQSLCQYENVTHDVLDYFVQFERKAGEAGIKNWILDPGFGFAKTIDQNYQMMRELSEFKSLGRKILVGISRKSMIFKLLDITPEECLAQTQVLHLAALQNGADILRVHDVEEAVRTVRLYRKL